MPEFVIAQKPTSNPLPAAERAALLERPGFGRYFTDHMVTVRWSAGRGWHDGELVPYAPFTLDPASCVLHYSQEIFEGLKAYRWADGSIATFRTEMNAERFRFSARRMALPELPMEIFVQACEALLRADHPWVPAHGGEDALYVRPFMIGTEVGLGVRPPSEVLFCVIASPVGPYFTEGIKPLTLWVSEDRVRAAPGGVGDAKTGGNYAASLLAQAEASAAGCDQVVYLDAVEHRWVEEMGAMNLFFVYGDRIVTPALSGSLLAGITRDSLLTLAPDLGYRVEEGRISIDQWQADANAGTLTEVFACGTAAVITPIGSARRAGAEWVHGSGNPGEATMRLREALLALQRGLAPDRYGWTRRITLPEIQGVR